MDKTHFQNLGMLRAFKMEGETPDIWWNDGEKREGRKQSQASVLRAEQASQRPPHYTSHNTKTFSISHHSANIYSLLTIAQTKCY